MVLYGLTKCALAAGVDPPATQRLHRLRSTVQPSRCDEPARARPLLARVRLRGHAKESAVGSQKSPSKPMLRKMPRISAAAGRRDTVSNRVLYHVTARCQS